MKKIAVISIKGGFGNQLFQVVFVNHLKKLGFKVFIDTSFFKLNENHLKQNNITKRSLILPLSAFNFRETNNLNIRLIKFLFNLLKRFNLKFNNRIVANKFTGHSFDINKTGFINIFDGYWKNPEILESNLTFLVENLSKNKNFSRQFNNIPNKNTLLVHVRRTDFIENGWDLSEDYYSESINFVFEKKGKQKIDIFTDDESWVKDSTFYKTFEINNIYKENKEESPFEDFIKMLNYENFIIGNSTFAFFPAYLKAKENSIVIVPDPWFKNGSHPNIAKSEWIKIKNI